MEVPLHTGHFPGFVSLSLFLKTKPHFLHSEDLTIRAWPSAWRLRRMCSRCAYTSFSGIPTIALISFADMSLPVMALMISRRVVSILSAGMGGRFLPVVMMSSQGWARSTSPGGCDAFWWDEPTRPAIIILLGLAFAPPYLQDWWAVPTQDYFPFKITKLS